MADDGPTTETTTTARSGKRDDVDARTGPVSALPPVGARVIAFAAIVVAGICGGLIGFALVDIQYVGDSSTPLAIGALVGAVISALGVSVVAVLVLRAMGEWRTIEHGRAGRRTGRGVGEDSAPHPRLRPRPAPGPALPTGADRPGELER
ncbi:MAG: hypothetical protein H0V33_00005 [Acidimicrobiia bacterium]|nr:hypothetical protein [Acidimicrobiia bacterium]